MRLLPHPATGNALDQLRNAGEAGLAASWILSVLDGVRPLPLAIDVVRELVERRLVKASSPPVTIASRLWITAVGITVLNDEVRAGRWWVEQPHVIEQTPEGRAAAEAAHRAETARDAAAYEDVVAVMTQGARPPVDAGAVELAGVLLAPVGAFLIATRESCVLHPESALVLQPARLPLVHLAAAVGAILSLAGADRVIQPTLLGFDRGELASGIGGFACLSFGPRLVWILPGADRLRMLVRAAPEDIAAPFARSIPDNGELAYREPAPWAPRVVKRQLDEARACPHCKVLATAYRALQDRLQCLGCARTFLETEAWA